MIPRALARIGRAPVFLSATQVIDLLQRSNGATILHMTEATGWLPQPKAFVTNARDFVHNARYRRRPALPRGSRFQCPAPPPGQAILNETRRKWSFRDDVPDECNRRKGKFQRRSRSLEVLQEPRGRFN